MHDVSVNHGRRQAIPLLFLALFSLSSADWQYKSHPDLSPPILNITIPAIREV